MTKVKQRTEPAVSGTNKEIKRVESNGDMAAEPKIVEVTIVVPVAICEDTQSPTFAKPRFVGVPLHSHTSKAAVSCLRIALRNLNVSLEDGRPVDSNARALRYVVEQIAAQITE